MKEMNLCNGCFYAGTENGFKPECNCKCREKYEEVEKQQEGTRTKCSNAVKTDSQRRLERRINRKKSNKRASNAIVFANAKCKRLMDTANNSIAKRQEKRYKNTVKKAKRNKQVTVAISLPVSIARVKGRCIYKLETLFSNWKENPETAVVEGTKLPPKMVKKMKAECKEALNMLEVARSFNGEVVSLHKKENEIHMTMGFYTKKDLSNFKRKMDIAS